jgi:hypothetical protein
VRILVSSVGAQGHTYPLLPLSIAAREAGHEILYATSASFHPLVGRLGFRPVLAGMEMREAFAQLAVDLGDQATPFDGSHTRALSTELGIDLPDDLPRGLGDPYIDICPASLQGAEFLATARRGSTRASSSRRVPPPSSPRWSPTGGACSATSTRPP